MSTAVKLVFCKGPQQSPEYSCSFSRLLCKSPQQSYTYSCIVTTLQNPLTILSVQLFVYYSAKPPTILRVQLYGNYSAKPPTILRVHLHGYYFAEPPTILRVQLYGDYFAEPPTILPVQLYGYCAAPGRQTARADRLHGFVFCALKATIKNHCTSRRSVPLFPSLCTGGAPSHFVREGFSCQVLLAGPSR